MKFMVSCAKKALICIVCMLMINIFNVTPVLALGLEDTVTYGEDVSERSLLDDIEAVSDIKYTRARNAHLNYAFVELKKVSPTRAKISATTQAHHVCTDIFMDIYLDRYDADTKKWYQQRYWEYSTTNSQHLTKNMEIIVQSGYYYSIRGYHSCMHDNMIETATTMTDGLYIGTTDKPII